MHTYDILPTTKPTTTWKHQIDQQKKRNVMHTCTHLLEKIYIDTLNIDAVVVRAKTNDASYTISLTI